jgi:hypothetical protein
VTINVDDRPGLPFHEGQTGDQLPEDVDGDKKKSPAGDGDKKDEDANPDSQAHDAHDKYVHSDSDKNNSSDVASSTDGEDRPELQKHEGQAGDQPRNQASQEKQDDGVQQGLPPHENHEGQASDQLPGEDENNGDNNVEDNNNDGDGAVPLAPNISPQFHSKDFYKVLGVSMNATEQQIKREYRNLARRHHPDCIPHHLSKDDSNRIFLLLIMPMRYCATWRKEGFMMHLCALVK